MSTTETTYSVEGMSCEHCVQAVTAEIGKLPGVEGVQVDLGSGDVRISSSTPLDDDAVRAAVDEAGYEVRS